MMSCLWKVGCHTDKDRYYTLKEGGLCGVVLTMPLECPHLLKISATSSNHMPNVSLAEGMHIGMRPATSAVRLSPLTQESSIDFHLIQKLRARHRNIVLCLLLLSARCVTLHLCPEGRPVGAILTRQSVATDKVRGHLVQPFARHIQLCQHFRFDRARRFTHLVHSCRTRLWDLHTLRERSFITFCPTRMLKRECPPTQKRIVIQSVVLLCHCRHQSLLAVCGYASVPRDTSMSGFNEALQVPLVARQM